jgi:hypothetical protein
MVEVIGVDEVDVETVAYYGPEPGANVPRCRELRLPGGRIALHHICTHPQLQAREDDPAKAWWACQELERESDVEMRYELNCRACAERYVGERRN